MKLIITDANIFYDIICIGALPEFFALDYEFCTTDFVENEILESNQKEQLESFIRAKKLHVFKLTIDEINEIMTFPTKRTFKGITDKTVLWKSHQLKCPLLTGDNKLKNEAEDLQIEVYGSIWVINELIEQKIITINKGVELLEALKFIYASLPQNEIDKIIKRLK